jgi:hypothetical protein
MPRIERNWRRWKSNTRKEGRGGSKATPSSSVSKSQPNSDDINSIDDDIKYRAYKYKKNLLQQGRIKKLPARYGSKKFNVKVSSEYYHSKAMKAASDEDSSKRHVYYEYSQDLGMSNANKMKRFMDRYNVNFKEAQSMGININQYIRIKTLANAFAIIMEKYAKYHTGYDVIGEDFWDMDELGQRCITKKNINKCRMSRAKENIILLIDSSPSCRREAAFFAAVASVAAKYDFIDMYDAPNMRITGKYNAKTMKFEHCWTDEQILVGMHKWPHFKDKNILAFGDDDGIQIINDNAERNKITYFNTLRAISSYNSSWRNKLKKKCTIYEGINDIGALVQCAKKLR